MSEEIKFRIDNVPFGTLAGEEFRIAREAPSFGPDRGYSCTYCEKVFPKISKLNSHISTHVKPIDTLMSFLCAFCDKKFPQVQLLKDHKKNVHNLVKNRCNICDKDFPFESNLTNHNKNVHGFLSFYQCGLCNMEFAHKSHCDKHMKIVHQDTLLENAHKIGCPFCEEKFDTKADKVSHLKKIHPHHLTTDDLRNRYFNGFTKTSKVE